MVTQVPVPTAVSGPPRRPAPVGRLARIRAWPAAEPGRPLLIAASAVAAIVTFVLVRGTLMPGVGYWDTGEAQTVPPVLGTFHPTGFPTYALLGWFASVVLQPFGDAAFRMRTQR